MEYLLINDTSGTRRYINRDHIVKLEPVGNTIIHITVSTGETYALYFDEVENILEELFPETKSLITLKPKSVEIFSPTYNN